MEPKRIALAVALAFGIFFIWQKFLAPPPPSQQAQPAAPAGGSGSTPAAAGSTSTNASAPSAGSPAAPPPGKERPPEQQVTLENDKARFVLSSWGASLRQVELKEKKFMHQEPGKPPEPYRMIGTTSPETAPLLISFPKADFKVPDLSSWQVVHKTDDEVHFRTENEAVAIEKHYKRLGPHRFWLDVVVENRSGQAINAGLALHLFGKQNPESKGGGIFGSASANLTSMVCYEDGKRNADRSTVDALLKEPSEKSGRFLWGAADDKYYGVVAVLGDAPPPGGAITCGRRALDQLTGETYLSLPPRTIAPQGSTTIGFDVFAGPKYRSELQQVNGRNGYAAADKVVDVTFELLSKPLLVMLKLFHGVVGNWGLAIILLTIFVKFITIWPAHKAMMSGRKMQRLAPKMAELRKKYEHDKQKLQIETMKLYKQEGVSPFLGGCLPSLLTMPIWIALFSTLNYAVELHREPFVWYIHDLSAPDPYRAPLPLIMGTIMFLQMRMSPTGGDPQQQKMMSVMMPIMFTAFSLFLPAGLAIYTMTNSLLGITHQLIVTRLDRKLNPPVVAVAAAPRGGGGGGKGKGKG